VNEVEIEIGIVVVKKWRRESLKKTDNFQQRSKENKEWREPRKKELMRV
jgi:hypothetical protein